MSKDKATLAHILDESAANVRAEILRVETEKKHVTARLDEWIAKLRAVLPGGDALPSREIPKAEPMTRSPANAPIAPKNGARPRGDIQVKIYEHLMAHPEAGYREIVEAVYGEYNEPHYNSTRNAIAALKKNGWVLGERGEWTLQEGKNT